MSRNPYQRRRAARRVVSLLSPLAALLATPSLALAQGEIPPVTPVAQPVPEETPVVEEKPVAPPVEVKAPPAAAPIPEVPAAPVEEKAPDRTMSMGVWGRIDVVLNNPADSEKLNDISSNGVGEFHFSGDVADGVGWTANLVAGYGGGAISGTAGIMDLIAQFGVHDSLNIWAGRMLVASDRSNFSGPWFMSPWDYPGLYTGGPPEGPMQGPSGRNDGVTVWGNVMDGHLKYYVAAFDLHDGRTAPLLSGRLNISLINPEPGFYSNSTYYGGKDLLAIGVGFQSKKDGSVGAAPTNAAGMVTGPAPVDDYSLINADVLFEKNFGDASGTLDLEAAFYSFSGDNQAVETHMFGVASYLLPFAVGPGKLQPTFRLQQAKTQAGDNTWQIIEGYLGYVVKDFSLRGSLGFVSTKLEGAGAGGEDAKSNAIKLGVQFMQ